jgi:hypothetical protein
MTSCDENAICMSTRKCFKHQKHKIFKTFYGYFAGIQSGKGGKLVTKDATDFATKA